MPFLLAGTMVRHVAPVALGAPAVECSCRDACGLWRGLEGLTGQSLMGTGYPHHS